MILLMGKNTNTKADKKTIHSDEPLQLITGQIVIGQGVLVAHELGLFRIINKNSLPLSDIAYQLQISQRAAQALVSCAGALGFIECKSGHYQLSKMGLKYLNEDSPGYYGRVLDLLISQHQLMDYDSIKRSILSDQATINQGSGLFKNTDNLSATKDFIDSLHYKAYYPAFYWSTIVDLKNHKTFVDIGGGSGIHTIAACLRFPNLQGIVCDRPEVLVHTQQFIQSFGLEHRIRVQELDMWEETFPRGDILFMGDILHDWKPCQCKTLIQKCFDSLVQHGKIVIHEMLFNGMKTGPFLTSAYNMKMMLWTDGQQLSQQELSKMLRNTGFKHISTKSSLGNWLITTGCK